MPLRHQIDEKWGIVVTTAEGEVTEADLVEFARALASDPRARELDELADLSGVRTTTAATQAVRRMGEMLLKEDTNRPGGRLALVAPTDALYGMARLYQVYRDHPEIEIGVFRERGQALSWLGINEKA